MDIPPATTELRLGAAVFYVILAVIGLASNLLLFTTFSVNAKFFNILPFYIIAWHICICDIISLFVQLSIAAPLTILAYNVYERVEIVYTVINLTDTIVYNCLLNFTFVMAINRFTVFILPNVNKYVFTKNNVYIIITLIYALTTFEVLFRNYAGCIKNFSTSGFYFFHTCYADNRLHQTGVVLKEINFYQSNGIPIIMFIMYLLLFFLMRCNTPFTANSAILNSSSAMYKRKREGEYNMLVQGAIICVSLELQTITFNFMPGIPVSGYGSYYLTFTQNVVSIINNSVNPFIYFAFSPAIRKCVRNLFTGTKTQAMDIFAILPTIGKLRVNRFREVKVDSKL